MKILFNDGKTSYDTTGNIANAAANAAGYNRDLDINSGKKNDEYASLKANSSTSLNGNIADAAQRANGLPNRGINDEYANPMYKADEFQNLRGSGNSAGFNDRMGAILNQGRLLQQQFENQANGNYGNVSVADIVRRNQEALGNSKEMAWAHQNPMGENMGYVWNDDKMKALNWSDDDIAQMKSITDMHPQMIEDLVNRGILRAPYREYLNERARLEAEARARAEAAAAASYNYSNNYGGGSDYSGGDNNVAPPPPPAPPAPPKPIIPYDTAISAPSQSNPYSYESLQDYYDNGVFRDN